MTVEHYAAIGVLIVTIIGWLFKWWIGWSLDARFARKEQEDAEFRREQIEDAIMTMKGQQVMTKSLLVILRHEIYGNHVEDLERSQADLQTFQADTDAAILKKAAKYNLR